MELSYGQKRMLRMIHNSEAPHRFPQVHGDSDMCMDLLWSNLRRLQIRGYVNIDAGVYSLTEQGKVAIDV